jgi:1,4-dihydroxy-2-naphthoate octaprenyltransferase
MGVPWAKTYHVILLGTAFLFALTYTIIRFDSYLQLLLLIPVPLLVSDVKKVIENTVPLELNAELKKLAMATLLFSLAFGLGLVL